MKALLSVVLLLAFGVGAWGYTPEGIEEWKEAAENGEAWAQIKLGYAYANGDGVPEDYAMAYAWWNIAAANGETTAKLSKADLAEKMTKEQIAEAQRLSREMIKAKPELLQGTHGIETEREKATEEELSWEEILEWIKKKLKLLPLPSS